jgi:hypothetical protein
VLLTFLRAIAKGSGVKQHQTDGPVLGGQDCCPGEPRRREDEPCEYSYPCTRLRLERNVEDIGARIY